MQASPVLYMAKQIANPALAAGGAPA